MLPRETTVPPELAPNSPANGSTKLGNHLGVYIHITTSGELKEGWHNSPTSPHDRRIWNNVKGTDLLSKVKLAAFAKLHSKIQSDPKGGDQNQTKPNLSNGAR